MYVKGKVEMPVSIYSNFKSAKHYKYRTAMVRDIIFIIDRNEETGRKLEEWLVKKCNANPDNHTAYAVELKSGKRIYILCSDSTMAFGLSIEEGMW